MPSKPKKSNKTPSSNTKMQGIGSGIAPAMDVFNGNDKKKGLPRQESTERGRRFIWVAPDSIIQDSPMQRRKPFDPDNNEIDREFLKNIKEQGVIVPIAVRLLEQQKGQNRQYICIAGHRRWAAAAACGVKEIPAVLYDGNADERTFHAHTIVENVHRKDLADLELAQSLRDYKELFDLSQAEVSKATGVSKPKISMLLKILSGPQEIIDLLGSNEIRWKNAYDIGMLPKGKRAKAIQAIRSGMGASSAMDLLQASEPKSTTKKTRKHITPDDFAKNLLEQLPQAAKKAIDSAGLFDKPAKDKLVFLALAVTEGTDTMNWDDALVRYKSIRVPVRKRIAKTLESINRAYSEAGLVSDDQADQVLKATINFATVLGRDK